MSDIIKHSFKINVSLLAALALYPPDKMTTGFKVRAFFTYISLIVLVTVFEVLFFIFEDNLTPTQINNGALFIAQMMCQMLKLLPFVINATNIKRCVDFLGKQQFLLCRDKHKQILNRCSWICRRNTIFFIISVIGGFASWVARPLFNAEQTLPIDIWLPFNLTSDSRATYFIYVYLALAVGYTSLACVSIDSLIAGLACLVTGHLNILEDNLQHVIEYVQECVDKQTLKLQKEKLIHDFIEHCIQHHNFILNFITEYEKCFSLPVFGQFLGSIIVIGFSCLELSKLEPLTYNFMSFACFIWIFLAQIYVYCYYGTILFEESNSIINAIYMGEWYEYDLKARKELIILMERSKRPITVTAGKIMDMSIQTFTKILKSTYSLLAVLKNM